MLSRFYSIAAILFLGGCTPPPNEPLTMPKEPPLQQIQVQPNSCGPCALVNAFSYASNGWRQPAFFQQAPALQAQKIISQYGKRPARDQANRSRWNPNKGINVTNLLNIANEISPKTLSLQSSHKNQAKPNSKELQRIFYRINFSLQHGFPPILSIKQQTHKKFRSKQSYYWVETSGHFITLLQARIDSKRENITISYIDPYDGEAHIGTLHFRSKPFETTSPLTLKHLIWQPKHIQANLPSLVFLKNLSTGNNIITTEIDSFILFQ